MRIPITMCHGISRPPENAEEKRNLLTAERFERYFAIAAGLGFQSISYDDLAKWRAGTATLPLRPVLFDFDHPVRSIPDVIVPIMERYGFHGNLFVNTEPMEKPDPENYMDWDGLRALVASGWHIGAHTHNHPRMDHLAQQDPSGGLLRAELEKCDNLLTEKLGIVPKDFAFTGTTWSQLAEDEVKKRYRFGRLWIVSAHYNTTDGQIRYADLVGVLGADEPDGGPPLAARYITSQSHPYRLPSMELEYLIHDYEAFTRYLKGAIEN